MKKTCEVCGGSNYCSGCCTCFDCSNDSIAQMVQDERNRAAGIVLKRTFPSVVRGPGMLEEIAEEILGK